MSRSTPRALHRRADRWAARECSVIVSSRWPGAFTDAALCCLGRRWRGYQAGQPLDLSRAWQAACCAAPACSLCCSRPKPSTAGRRASTAAGAQRWHLETPRLSSALSRWGPSLTCTSSCVAGSMPAQRTPQLLACAPPRAGQPASLQCCQALLQTPSARPAPVHRPRCGAGRAGTRAASGPAAARSMAQRACHAVRPRLQGQRHIHRREQGRRLVLVWRQAQRLHQQCGVRQVRIQRVQQELGRQHHRRLLRSARVDTPCSRPAFWGTAQPQASVFRSACRQHGQRELVSGARQARMACALRHSPAAAERLHRKLSTPCQPGYSCPGVCSVLAALRLWAAGPTSARTESTSQGQTSTWLAPCSWGGRCHRRCPHTSTTLWGPAPAAR